MKPHQATPSGRQPGQPLNRPHQAQPAPGAHRRGLASREGSSQSPGRELEATQAAGPSRMRVRELAHALALSLSVSPHLCVKPLSDSLTLWEPTCKYVRLTQAASPCNASLCFCRNIYRSADLVQTNAFSALSKAHRDCKKAKGKTSKLERQQRERKKKNHAIPPNGRQLHPHPARRAPCPSMPWKGPSAAAEDRESGGKRQHWLGSPPAGRGRHRWADSARRGPL